MRTTPRSWHLALAAPLIVPLTLSTGWETLAFRGIPANVVTFGDSGLTIAVDRSAGPLVWRLPAPMVVHRLAARGRVSGAVRTTPARQGQPGADDFALKVGLVVSGSRRPGLLERRFAPAWVQRLFALAPDGGGIDHIAFFALGVADAQIGQARIHPDSGLVRELLVAAPDATGRFSMDLAVNDLRVLAVWLSADGDDTRSTFTVHLDQLELTAAPAQAGR